MNLNYISEFLNLSDNYPNINSINRNLFHVRIHIIICITIYYVK